MACFHSVMKGQPLFSLADISPKDRKYVEAILFGNQGDLEQLYADFFSQISRHIFSHGGNQADAEDIFQEGIIVVYKKLQNKEFSLTSSFGSFLYGICKYLWMNQLRKKKRGELPLDTDKDIKDDDELDEIIFKREQYRLFQSKLLQLGEDCQRLLRLFFEGVSMREIAKIMGYKSENYAKKKKFTCKSTLINKIEADPVYRELRAS